MHCALFMYIAIARGHLITMHSVNLYMVNPFFIVVAFIHHHTEKNGEKVAWPCDTAR